MPRFATSLAAIVVLASTTAFAQQVALFPEKTDCPSQEPDSVQISWDQPCTEGDWLFDTEAGCRMWDWHPDPHDRAVWSGACAMGVMEGRGVVQWYEHGQPIDRFEGTYRHGKREGFGRYEWNGADSFEGSYANDVPHGFGTAALAGQTFKGEWKKGCFRQGGRIVAIGVPRRSCGGVPSASRESNAAGI
jgi:hypothetical protein